MKRIEPIEGAKCEGVLSRGCPHKANSTHLFVEATDFGLIIQDLCSECYESEMNGHE